MKGAGTWRRGQRKREGSGPCKAHKTVPGWKESSGLALQGCSRLGGVKTREYRRRRRDREGPVARTTQRPQGNGKTRGAGNRQRWVNGRGTKERNIAGERSGIGGAAEKTEQQPRGIGEPVAME